MRRYAGRAMPVNAGFATATTRGTIAAGTHYYRVSALDGAGGETLASAETSQVTTGATSTVTVNWTKVTGATGYKVYGRATGAEQLIATVGDVATYTRSEERRVGKECGSKCSSRGSPEH